MLGAFTFVFERIDARFEPGTEVNPDCFELVVEAHWRFEDSQKIIAGLADYNAEDLHRQMDSALLQIFDSFADETFETNDSRHVVQSAEVDLYGGIRI